MNYLVSIIGFLGGQEIILIVLIVLILFGGRKIPELMKGLGKGIKEFKSATSAEKKEDTEENNEPVEEKKND